MDYEEDLVHNALPKACNTVVLVTLKVEENILCMIRAPVIAPQPITPINPAANLSHAFLKALNALVITQVCIPCRKLKAARLLPKLGEVQAQ